MIHIHQLKLQTFTLMITLSMPLGAATLCVNASGQGCQKTIAAAVAAAAAGDTINIGPGIYKESVTIGKTLSLVGLEAGKTIIEAAGLGTGITIDGIGNKNLSGVVISGLTIQNANYEGILVTNSSNITITGNILAGNNKGLKFVPNGPPACPGIPTFETLSDFDCGEAIHLSGVHHSTVSNNNIQNNAGGILLSDDTGATHDNLIAGNIVSNNPSDCGITLASHPPADITGSKDPLGVYANTIVANTANSNGLKGEGAGVGIFASDVGTKNYGNVVLNNTLMGNELPGISVHGHAPQQNLDGNVFIGNRISGNGADTDDSFTPATAGINFYSFSPVSGTVIAQNVIDGEGIGVAWNAPGEARIQRNSLIGGIGVYNLGSGTVNAEGNWWGCAGGPVGVSAIFAGCSTTAGAVTVNTWAPAAPK